MARSTVMEIDGELMIVIPDDLARRLDLQESEELDIYVVSGALMLRRPEGSTGDQA